MSSQTIWSSGKNVSIGVLHQMESTLKVADIETCKNKYIIFINKFWFWGVPPYIFTTYICTYVLICIPYVDCICMYGA